MGPQGGIRPPASADSTASAARRQLQDALQAMALLQPFDPRLAGALAAGTADPRLPIVLHVQAEHADDVLHLLAGRGIPARMRETRMYPPRAATQPLPGVSFMAGEQEILIWIFSEAQFRQRVRIGDEGAASPRMTRAAVERALAGLTAGP